MPTLSQANTYNAARENNEWAVLFSDSASRATALLEDAEAYVRSVYDVRFDLTADEQKLLDNLICRLATTFIKNPPAYAATASIKKQSSDLKGLKKETEFNETDSDPYPYITAVIRPLTVQRSAFSNGRMVRR